MISCFLAIVLDSQQLKQLEGVLKKYNPLYKFLPPHIALSRTFEIEASEKGYLLNPLKSLAEEIEPFDLFFKGFIQIKSNVHLKLENGENYLKKLRIRLSSLESLKKIDLDLISRHSLNHPLLAKNKSVQGVKKILPFKTEPTFKIKASALTLAEIGRLDEEPLRLDFNFIKRDLPE